MLVECVGIVEICNPHSVRTSEDSVIRECVGQRHQSSSAPRDGTAAPHACTLAGTYERARERLLGSEDGKRNGHDASRWELSLSQAVCASCSDREPDGVKRECRRASLIMIMKF